MALTPPTIAATRSWFAIEQTTKYLSGQQSSFPYIPEDVPAARSQAAAPVAAYNEDEYLIRPTRRFSSSSAATCCCAKQYGPGNQNHTVHLKVVAIDQIIFFFNAAPGRTLM